MRMSLLVLSLAATVVNASTMLHAAAAPATRPAEDVRTGVLRGGLMAIGGETTGWHLEAGGKSIEVDVAAVRKDAESLDGKRVAVTGTVITKEYVERGPTKILVASKIVAAPGK